jgi:hypothetical protein
MGASLLGKNFRPYSNVSLGLEPLTARLADEYSDLSIMLPNYQILRFYQKLGEIIPCILLNRNSYGVAPMLAGKMSMLQYLPNYF